MQLDLSWLASAGIAFASAALPILGSVFVYLLNASKVSATAKALIDQVMVNGASLAATKLGDVHIAHAGVLMKKDALSSALSYVVTAAGSALKAKGYDPATSSGMTHILSMIEARVPLVQAAIGVTAAPKTATAIEAQPLLTLGTALAADVHTVTTGEALGAARAAISLVPDADKAKAVTAVESVLPANLKGALGIVADVAGLAGL